MLDLFSVASLEGYGCAGLPLAVSAAGSIVGYLKENQKAALALLTHLATYSTQSFMTLDTHTSRNLELYSSVRWGTAQGSLLSAIDLTKTSMGGRLLKRFLGQPLLDVTALEARQSAVEWFHGNTLTRSSVISLLNDIPDMERIINRVKSGNANARDLVALKSGLEKTADIQSALAEAPTALIEGLKLCPDVIDLVAQSIADEPAVSFDHGGVIRQGFSEELDKVRVIASDAKQFLAGLEKQEREKTGIRSLKLGYNRVFGYYIEVSTSNLGLGAR